MNDWGGIGVVGESRIVAVRRADQKTRRADRLPAAADVERLLSGPTPTDQLDAVLRAEEAPSPLRRLAPVQVLADSLEATNRGAATPFKAITADQAGAQAVQEGAAAASVTPRLKDIVGGMAADWEYEPPQAYQQSRELSRPRPQKW